MQLEFRNISFDETTDKELETRAATNEDGTRQIMGYAAVKNSESRQISEYINGEFRTFTEILKPEAFDNADMRDIVHLVDHDHSRMIGKVGANTIVQNTERGLFFKTTIPAEGKASSHQEDLYRMTEQQIIKGASFAFRVAKDGDSWSTRGGQLYRTISKIERVFDVTSTFLGAYEMAYTFQRTLNMDTVKVEDEPKPEPIVEPAKVEQLVWDAETIDLDFKMTLLKNKSI